MAQDQMPPGFVKYACSHKKYMDGFQITEAQYDDIIHRLDAAETHKHLGTDTLQISGKDLIGAVSISHGGTGQTTQQAAIDALLPSQASQSGKFLTTNGIT